MDDYPLLQRIHHYRWKKVPELPTEILPAAHHAICHREKFLKKTVLTQKESYQKI